MTDQSQLERRYRRLLACYPRAFRREHEDEMLVVLLALARDRRRGPGIADAANLLGNALWMRIRPAAPRSLPSVFWGVRLMVAAAFLELVAIGTAVASEGAVRAAVTRHFPHFSAAHWAAVVHGQIVPVEIGAPIAAAVWLLLAWANDRGYRWGRGAVPALFGLTSIGLLTAVSHDAATYASADLIVGGALCLVALAATLLIIGTDSNRHYDRPGSGDRRLGPGPLRPTVAGPVRPDPAAWN
jgi:hypothetical protein